MHEHYSFWIINNLLHNFFKDRYYNLLHSKLIPIYLHLFAIFCHSVSQRCALVVSRNSNFLRIYALYPTSLKRKCFEFFSHWHYYYYIERLIVDCRSSSWQSTAIYRSEARYNRHFITYFTILTYFSYYAFYGTRKSRHVNDISLIAEWRRCSRRR